MARGELESLFARYREHADLDALARVFDLAAPQLLRVARHVARDEGAAEDLVQATFVAAIEHAARFDVERELVVWLVGILSNKAKLARALSVREPDRERLAEREARDPALDAELAEFAAALEVAVQRVPSKYREVVLRAIAHGKKPEEIARELGREPGTVRVQLHRGLVQLRRLLPPSFALGLGVALAPRGLGAVRGAVLRHAERAAATSAAASSSVIGGWIVSTKMVAAAAVVVIAVAALWWFAKGDATRIESSAAALERRDSAAVSEAPSNSSDEDSASRHAVDVAGPASSDPHESYGALDIEVVWYDRSPAVNVELELVPQGERQPRQEATVRRHG